VESSCERGNEYSGFIKRWETTEWLHVRFEVFTAVTILRYIKTPVRTSQETLVSATEPGGSF
jgi:hypothetical protein